MSRKTQPYRDYQVRAALGTHWYAATPEQRKDGRDWYKHALLAATNMAIQHGVSVRAAAAVIATLSPQHTWAQNLKLAEECLGGGVPKCFKKMATKACVLRDWDGGDIPLELVAGPKVSEFFLAILGMEDAVVLDRWMLRAMGLDGLALTEKRYDELSEMLREVAREVGVTPAVFQATVWCVVRGKSY